MKVSGYWMQNITKTAGDGVALRLWWWDPAWFFALIAAGVALRLFFVLRFPFFTPDGVVYGDLAKNWLLHGVYGLSAPSGPAPTYIRLPGYPAFMAALWAVFGVEHYNAVRFAQVLVDVGTCFIVADLARRVTGNALRGEASQQVVRWAFALAALCPFLANYTALPLTETLSIFFSALALDLAVAALVREEAARDTSSGLWAACGLAIAAAIYLRPDNGVLLIAIGATLLYRLACRPGKRRTLSAGIVLAIFSLGPLAPWTMRNWRDFHRFQPLAPTHAEEPGEFYAAGFDRWMRTWLLDYASLEDIGFHVEGEPIDINTVPNRAFEDSGEHRKTAELFDAYNENFTMTPEVDAQFQQLARGHIRRHRLRCYVALPLLRVADVWLRPRTEMLPLDSHWWRWRDDPRDFAWSLLLGAINLIYVGLALRGALRWRMIRYAGMLAAFVVIRTLVITVFTFPEPRYLLECYPVMIVFASVGLPVSRRLSPSLNRSLRADRLRQRSTG